MRKFSSGTANFGKILILAERSLLRKCCQKFPSHHRQVRASSQPATSCRACSPALLVKVDRMVIVVSRLLGTVCGSGGGHLVRARRRRHVRVLRIPGDVSAGRWRGHFTDLLVVLEGTRWRVQHGGRAERRATVRGAARGADRRASRGTRKGQPMLRESVRARGHDPGGADAQVQPAQGGLRAERG